MSEDASLIGRGIRNLRMRKRMTLDQLASASGVAVRRLKAIEKGASALEEELRRLAQGLGLDAEHFVPAKNEPEAQSATAPTAAKKSSERTKRSKKNDTAEPPTFYGKKLRDHELALLDMYRSLNKKNQKTAWRLLSAFYFLQVEEESTY